MSDLQTVIAEHRQVVADFVATAGALPPSDWARPCAPGKWSPAQVTEHVALTYEKSRGILQETFSGPAAPRMLRPLLRRLFLNPVLKAGSFRKSVKTIKQFEPGAAPEAAEILTTRVEAAAADLEEAFETAAQSGHATVNHPFFGSIPLAQYLRFQVIHTRHHKQHLTPAI